MSLKSYNELAGEAVKLPSDVKLTKQRISARCKEEKFGPSSKGHLMVTRTWEVVHPEESVIAGKKYTLAGIEFQQYLITRNVEDPQKSDAALGRFMEDLKKMACDGWDQVDDENPPLVMQGKVASIIIDSDEYVPTEAPTEEELAQGKKVGKPITMEDGTPIKRYRPKFVELLGPSTVVVNKAY